MTSTWRFDVPGRPEYLRLVRLAAADSGTRADLSIEEVEDLRIAVDELTYALMGDDPAERRPCRPHDTRYRPGRVEIEGNRGDRRRADGRE